MGEVPSVADGLQTLVSRLNKSPEVQAATLNVIMAAPPGHTQWLLSLPEEEAMFQVKWLSERGERSSPTWMVLNKNSKSNNNSRVSLSALWFLLLHIAAARIASKLEFDAVVKETKEKLAKGRQIAAETLRDLEAIYFLTGGRVTNNFYRSTNSD